MHSMRNIYPVAFIVGPTCGFFRFIAILNYPYVEWLFYTAAALILLTIPEAYCWIEVQDLPEQFSYWC